MTFGVSLRGSLHTIAVVALVLSFGQSGYAQPRRTAGAAAPDAGPAPELQQFCTNNAAAAADAHIAWQRARLAELEAQIHQRLQDLESKKLEIAAWLRKRDEAMRQASETIVAIYSRMRPDAAAAQLGALDEAVAAAILAKLPARAASVILNEMEAGRAAKVTRGMVAPEPSPAEKKS